MLFGEASGTEKQTFNWMPNQIDTSEITFYEFDDKSSL